MYVGSQSPQSSLLGLLLSVLLTEADEGPGGKREGAKQAEVENRWTPEQQPPCLR